MIKKLKLIMHKIKLIKVLTIFFLTLSVLQKNVLTLYPYNELYLLINEKKKKNYVYIIKYKLLHE